MMGLFNSRDIATMNALKMLIVLLAGTTASALHYDHRHHHAALIMRDFGGQLRCPYAAQWLTKGPERAAADLGLMMHDDQHQPHKTHHDMQQRHRNNNSRKLQQEVVAAASCSFTDAFSSTPTCLELRGSAWTTDSLQARCDAESGTLAIATPCPLPAEHAGTCIVVPSGDNNDGTVEATPLALGAMGCLGMKNICESFIGGTFEASEACAAAAADTDDDDSSVFCEIAPGPIGAAHQAGYANGYFANCPGTPGESSPYQWPTAWAADTDSKSVPFGNDTVIYHSMGRVYYRLDRNWKRADTTYTRGIQRSIGQGPCPEEDVVVNDPDGSALTACRRDSDRRRTMIHRGSQMYFINWKNGTVDDDDDDDVANIEDCQWLDLQIVGNVRPDWFMDDRGDDTDVQYLGDQHVYYNGMPRLVKQWRKKDFANQYFTMSMASNIGSDGIHWPLILNVPGEGFGDDYLSIYTNHRTLTDDDDDLFLLDQALVASGGSCPQMNSTGNVGPPTNVETIPSNLEIDPNAWFSNVYTFSPVWEPTPPRLNDESTGDDATASGMNEAITEAGIATVGSCYDSASRAVQISLAFNDLSATGESELPWIALGYRQDEECVMNKDGADTEIILIANNPITGTTSASKGLLFPSAKTLEVSAIASIYTTLTPLDSTEGYSDVSLAVSSRTETDSNTSAQQTRSADLSSDPNLVRLKFKQSVDKVPEVMHLMYAIGSGPELGYHASRLCFEVTQFPECVGEPAAADDTGATATTDEDSGGARFGMQAIATVSTVMALYLFCC